MKALIDGDIVVYRAAASAEEDDQWIAQARADQMMQDILADTGSTSYSVYLTGSGNFRREIAPSYKANRPDSRPKHWEAVREFLVTQHKAVVCNGFEADDQLGIDQDKTHGATVICSIDKDLLQIPGKHMTKESKHCTYKAWLVIEATTSLEFKVSALSKQKKPLQNYSQKNTTKPVEASTTTMNATTST